MTMSEYIKKLRQGGNIYGKTWSQEELGAALNPPVNRAAVNKWEKGTVQNIKRTHIEQLAALFGISPCDLMCFEVYDKKKVPLQETTLLSEIQSRFGIGAIDLLICFGKLNNTGKEKALNYISDIIENPKYTK